MTVTLSQEFLQALAQKPKVYRLIWLDWLSGYADEILEPDFLERLPYNNAYTGSSDELKEVLEFGRVFWEQGHIVFKRNKENIFESVAVGIIEHLNAAAGTTFNKKAKGNLTPIIARLRDRYTPQDCITVIDRQVAKWKGTEWEVYLRPSTLFNPKHFENYLNGKIAAKSESSGIEKFAGNLNAAAQGVIFNKE